VKRTTAVLLVLALSGCDTRAREWTAWVYSDRDDLTKSESMLGYKNFEACQEGAIAKVRSLPDPDAADYECGYMCRYDPTLDTNVCKETRK
jgi:hypothetical protein